MRGQRSCERSQALTQRPSQPSTHLPHVVKPLAQAGRLVGAVEDVEGACRAGVEGGGGVGWDRCRQQEQHYLG